MCTNFFRLCTILIWYFGLVRFFLVIAQPPYQISSGPPRPISCISTSWRSSARARLASELFDFSVGVPVSHDKMASMWLIWAALVVIQLGFGAYGVVVARFAVKNKADPLIFSMIRDAGAFPVILLAAFISERRMNLPQIR